MGSDCISSCSLLIFLLLIYSFTIESYPTALLCFFQFIYIMQYLVSCNFRVKQLIIFFKFKRSNIQVIFFCLRLTQFLKMFQEPI